MVHPFGWTTEAALASLLLELAGPTFLFPCLVFLLPTPCALCSQLPQIKTDPFSNSLPCLLRSTSQSYLHVFCLEGELTVAHDDYVAPSGLLHKVSSYVLMYHVIWKRRNKAMKPTQTRWLTFPRFLSLFWLESVAWISSMPKLLVQVTWVSTSLKIMHCVHPWQFVHAEALVLLLPPNICMG